MPALTLSSDFDQAAFSDIIVQARGREFKCHKLILFNGCEVFAELLDPEDTPKTHVDLTQYWPEGVEAVLRHCYGHKYGMGADGERQELTPQHHLHVLHTAVRLKCTEVQTQAMEALEADLGSITSTCSLIHRDTRNTSLSF